MPRVVPMIHVPDVRATREWYLSIGFEPGGTNEDDGEMNWAALRYGDSEIMLNAGGKPSRAERREVDLYIQVEDVETTFQWIRGRVGVVKSPHDTFYGMREFMIRDLNGFWITFGQLIR